MADILMIKPAKPDIPKVIKRAASPPLGLMYLAAYAREKRPGKDSFTIIDERVHPKTLEQWEKYLAENKPDYIGLSVLSDDASRLKSLLPHFKRVVPDVPIILGGPHISAWRAKVFRQVDADYLVQGEGELAFVQLLDVLNKEKYYPKEPISGLIYKDRDESVVENPPNINLLDVNELPFPAWDLIDLEDYRHMRRMDPTSPVGESDVPRYAALFTSRGCPYSCIYCHDIFTKKFRMMNSVRVADEIEYLIDTYDVHDFEIYDDIFNLDYQRVIDICGEIKRRGLETHFSFPNAIRGDLLDRRILKELRSVGTYHMSFAVESASPRLQKFMRKRVKLDKIQENIAIATEEGIFAWGFFMLGFPTETRAEMWSTLKFAFSSKLHGAWFFIVIPQGGTQLAQMCAEKSSIGRNPLDTDYRFAKNDLSEVSPRMLTFIQSLAYIVMFSDPRRIIRIYQDYPYNVRNLPARAVRMFFYSMLGRFSLIVENIFGDVWKIFKGQYTR